MSGWNIIGHAGAVELLRRSLLHGRLSHAYLFSGPHRVGKRTLAVELARALNCEQAGLAAPKDSPCSVCRRCRLIAAGKHPEVRVVGLQPSHHMIRVADIETIQSDAALRPADVYRKVYIIEQAELLHPDAANRLLKTIEEPPPSVVMVLTSIDPEATLPTIVSRCQHIRLGTLPRGSLARQLVQVRGLTPDKARLVAAVSEGRVGWALEAAADATLLERRDRLLDELIGLVTADRFERLQYARSLADRWSADPQAVRETLDIWLRWWRDVLLIQHGVSDEVANVDRRAQLEQHAQQLVRSAVATAAGSARDTWLMLEQNANARLALDVAVLDLPRPGEQAGGAGAPAFRHTVSSRRGAA